MAVRSKQLPMTTNRHRPSLPPCRRGLTFSAVAAHPPHPGVRVEAWREQRCRTCAFTFGTPPAQREPDDTPGWPEP